MLSRIVARVRGLAAINSSENREDEQIIINNRGDLIITQSLPELTEVVRLGNSWQVASSSGVTGLAALPTTTAGLSLYNGELATGMCYAIDSFGSTEEVADATQADTSALFAMMNKVPATAPTDAALSIRSMSGRTNYSGKARTLAAGTVTNDGWFAHGPQGPLAPAAAGTTWKVNETLIKGLYLIPPGGMFNIAVVKAAAQVGSQQFYFIRWHEVQIIFKN